MADPSTSSNALTSPASTPQLAGPTSSHSKGKVGIEYIAAPVAGMTVAVFTAMTRIVHEFYDKNKNQYGLRELREIRNLGRDLFRSIRLSGDSGARLEEFRAAIKDYPLPQDGSIIDKARSELIASIEEGAEKLMRADREDTYRLANLLQAGKKMEDIYTKNEKELLAELGFTKRFSPRRLLQYWSELGHDTRAGILSATVISAAVSVGSLFILGQNIRLKRELTDIHQSLNMPDDDPPSSSQKDQAPPHHPAHHMPLTTVHHEGREYAGLTEHAAAQAQAAQL